MFIGLNNSSSIRSSISDSEHLQVNNGNLGTIPPPKACSCIDEFYVGLHVEHVHFEAFHKQVLLLVGVGCESLVRVPEPSEAGVVPHWVNEEEWGLVFVIFCQAFWGDEGLFEVAGGRRDAVEGDLVLEDCLFPILNPLAFNQRTSKQQKASGKMAQRLQVYLLDALAYFKEVVSLRAGDLARLEHSMHRFGEGS